MFIYLYLYIICIYDMHLQFEGIMTALPPKLPKSQIVYGNKFSFQQQIVMIYQKYIDIDAPLWINLSSETRDRFEKTLSTILTPTIRLSSSAPTAMEVTRQTTASTKTATTTTKTMTPITSTGSKGYYNTHQYEEAELWGLLLVFEDCISELYRLLNSSWKRLRETLKLGLFLTCFIYYI